MLNPMYGDNSPFLLSVPERNKAGLRAGCVKLANRQAG